MDTKNCSRCGLTKPLVDFRTYYNSPGTYKYCRSCERIETRYKYLKKRGAAVTPVQIEELTKIELMYEIAYDKGLDAPGRVHRATSVSNLVDDQLARLNGG